MLCIAITSGPISAEEDVQDARVEQEPFVDLKLLVQHMDVHVAAFDLEHRGAGRRRLEAGLPIRVQGVGARCGMYVGLDPAVDVTTYEQAARMDRRMMNAFCRDMHARGSS